MFKHISKLNKFSLVVDGVEVSYILYKQTKADHLDLYETITEKLFEGKGYATQLAHKTFEDCQNKRVKIQLSCTFLQHVYDKNPAQYDNLRLPGRD
ncbi:hypothetical protein WDU94_003055 [Cyamophila willieti]